MRSLLIPLVAIFWLASSLAVAEDFQTRSCSNRSGKCLTFTSADGTNDSQIIRLNDNRTYNLFFDPDTLVSTVPVDGAQVFLRASSSCTTASDNTSSRVLVNQDGAGGVDDVAMDGTNTTNSQRWAIYDLTAGCYFIERSVAAAAGDNAQVNFEED
jgi:hypothetical protein